MPKGFNLPKGQNPMNMMQQLQKLQEQIQQTQAELAEETVSATVGGGGVTVVMTGDQRCRSVEIEKELLADGDVDMIQDMLLTAVNAALDKSRELAAQRLGPLTGGLPF
jgi:nucleoid-associated protein EbfC